MTYEEKAKECHAAYERWTTTGIITDEDLDLLLSRFRALAAAVWPLRKDYRIIWEAAQRELTTLERIYNARQESKSSVAKGSNL